jgi:hypothetical protein
MYAPVVVPADEFLEYPPKMPFIPDQHSVETLQANGPYQPLHVFRRLVSAERAAKFAKALGYPVSSFVTAALEDQLRKAGLKMRVTIDVA